MEASNGIKKGKHRTKSKSPHRLKSRTSTEIPKEKATTLRSAPPQEKEPADIKRRSRSAEKRRSRSAEKRRSKSAEKRRKSHSPEQDKRATFQRAKSSPNNAAGVNAPKSSPENKRKAYKRTQSSPVTPKRKLSPKRHSALPSPRIRGKSSPVPPIVKILGQHSPSPTKGQRIAAIPSSGRGRRHSPVPPSIGIPYPPLVQKSPSNRQAHVDREAPSTPHQIKISSPNHQNKKSIRKSKDFPRMVTFDHSPHNSPPANSNKKKMAIPVKKPKKPPLQRAVSETPKERWMNYKSTDEEAYVFENDSNFQKCLRYFRVLPPHPDEHPIKKRIRHLIWYTLLVDFVVALVSILSYGEATTCCGEPIFSLPSLDLNDAINIMMYIYMIGLIVEIHPVVREGPIPWNLMNPVFGFFIGFVVFVDDSPVEAVSVWIMELVSVVLEFVTYRHYVTLFGESAKELEHMEERLAQNPKRGYKRITIQRERREMREDHSKARAKLRKHLIGVSINVVLVVVTLLLIIFVAKSGGMCVKDNNAPNIFQPDQQEECDLCNGRKCQVCNLEEGGETQCYFPYF